MKCLKLTTKSWLIGFGGEQAGLLFEKTDSFLYLSMNDRIEFSSFDKVIEKFGELVVEDTQPAQSVITHINSFPVKHPDAIIASDDPPSYTRGGNMVFVAGYWGLKYSNGWTLAFCPKQDTIKLYETVGPFINRIEALNRISRANNQMYMGREN